VNRARRLKSLLNKLKGEEEIEFIIPHTFLPPRYREMAERHNMILVFDRDMTLHVRWEGVRLLEWNSISSGEARRIVSSVLRHLAHYEREVRVFSRFLDANAELPFEDPRFDASVKTEEETEAKPAPVKREVSGTVTAIPFTAPTKFMFAGGESPLPDFGEW